MVEKKNTNRKLRFRITLRIRHPELNSELISEALEIQPDVCWTAGEFRQVKSGVWSPKVSPSTYWAASKDYYGRRFFFDSSRELIQKLSSAKDFLVKIVDTGGENNLTVNLRGNANIGDELKWQDFTLLTELKMSLGIEVFPANEITGAQISKKSVI